MKLKALLGLFFGIFLILLPALAQDTNTCSFSYKGSVTSGISPGYSYNAKATSWTDTNAFNITLTNAQYLPTYLYMEALNPYAQTGIYVKYYKPNSTGACVLSTTYTTYDKLGVSGTVYIRPDNVAVGTWSLVRNGGVTYFAASYYIDKITSGQINPIGKTLDFVIQSAWQNYDTDCGIADIRIAQPALTINDQPASGSIESILSSISTVTSSRTIPLVLSNNINTVNTTVNVRGSFLVIKSVNITVTHDRTSNIFITDIMNGFDGKLYIVTPQNKSYDYGFVANRFVEYFIPHYGDTILINDAMNITVIAFDLKQKLSCLNPAYVGLKKLKLVDLAGNQIMVFSVKIGDMVYDSDSSGYVQVSDLKNQTVTVYPLKRTDLNFTTTISTVNDITTLTANTYVYTVSVVVRQIDILGKQSPASFSYTVNGTEYKDKVNVSNSNFLTQGTGFDTVTLYLLPGNYNVKLRTSTLIFARENTTGISLFDTNYYRKLTWTVGLTSDSFSETLQSNPILSILVVDQKGSPVANAQVEVYDQNGYLLAPQATNSSGTAIFSVQPGYNYTVKVYYAGNLKTIKDIYYPATEMAMHVTIPISITEAEKSAVQGNQTVTNQGQAVANLLIGIMTNFSFIAFMFIILLSAMAAKIGGPEIGILAIVGSVAVFTFIVPVLPVQLLALFGLVAGIIFGIRIVRR